MRKRILLSVMIVLTMMLTGCGPFKAAANKAAAKANDISVTAIQEKIKSLGGANVSEKTKAAASELQKTINRYNNQDSGWNIFKAIKDDNYCMPWNAKAQQKELFQKIDNGNKILNKSMSNDAKNSFRSSTLKKVVPVIIVIIVLVALLALLSRKRVKKPIAIETSAPKQDATVTSANHTGLLKSNKHEDDLRALCAEGNLDFDRVTAKFGTDQRGMVRAYMKLKPLVSAGRTDDIEDLLS